MFFVFFLHFFFIFLKIAIAVSLRLSFVSWTGVLDGPFHLVLRLFLKKTIALGDGL